MRLSLTVLCAVLATSPAAAQVHEKHTAAHDSAHAIMLSDADHVALHQFLLGRWMGPVPMHGGAHHDTLNVRFENDSLHQMLMVRQHEGVSGFVIRGDSLQWKPTLGGAACMATTSVSVLVKLAKAGGSGPAQIKGTAICGAERTQFTLKKIGS